MNKFINYSNLFILLALININNNISSSETAVEKRKKSTASLRQRLAEVEAAKAKKATEKLSLDLENLKQASKNKDSKDLLDIISSKKDQVLLNNSSWIEHSNNEIWNQNLPFNVKVSNILFSPNNQYLAIITQVNMGEITNKTVQIYSLEEFENSKASKALKRMAGSVSDVDLDIAFLPHVNYIVTINHNGNIKFYNYNFDCHGQHNSAHTSSLSLDDIMKNNKVDLINKCKLVLSADGKILITSANNEIKIWDISEFSETNNYYDDIPLKATAEKCHAGPITALALSPNKLLLASAGLDKKVKLWNIADLNKCMQCKEFSHIFANRITNYHPINEAISNGIFGLYFSNDSNFISVSYDLLTFIENSLSPSRKVTVFEVTDVGSCIINSSFSYNCLGLASIEKVNLISTTANNFSRFFARYFEENKLHTDIKIQVANFITLSPDAKYVAYAYLTQQKVERAISFAHAGKREEYNYSINLKILKNTRKDEVDSVVKSILPNIQTAPAQPAPDSSDSARCTIC